MPGLNNIHFLSKIYCLIKNTNINNHGINKRATKSVKVAFQYELNDTFILKNKKGIYDEKNCNKNFTTIWLLEPWMV